VTKRKHSKKSDNKSKKSQGRPPGSWLKSHWRGLLVGLISFIIVRIAAPVIVHYLNGTADYKDKLDLLTQKIESADELGYNGFTDQALGLCIEVESQINKNKEVELFSHLKYIMANCYLDLSQKHDKEQNLRMAIECCKEGIKVLKNDSNIVYYAINYGNLGLAYGNLAEIRSQTPYLDSSQIAIRKAMDALATNKYPIMSVKTKINLSITYCVLSDNCRDLEHRGDYLRKGIDGFQYILQQNIILTDKALRSGVLVNLANALDHLSELENRIDNLYKAKMAIAEAQEYYTPEISSFDYAKVKNNMAMVLLSLGTATDSLTYLDQAIPLFQEIAIIYTLNEYPYNYAATFNNMGNAYMEYAARTSNKTKYDYYQRSISCYQEALKVRNITNYPLDYAQTMGNMGKVYYQTAQLFKKKENILKAIGCYEKELEIHTLKSYPMGYGSANFGLANCYRNLAESDDRQLNLIKSIESFKLALLVLSRESSPDDFANCNYLMGNVFMDLFKINNDDSILVQATNSYKNALAVYTEERYPDFHKKLEALYKSASQKIKK
jgi:tetratricopeptide (TPR) repeat protein